jgi:hypothetical protein
MKLIKDYSNETTIENLPYGYVYKFKVGILVNGIPYWSDESESVDLSISE